MTSEKVNNSFINKAIHCGLPFAVWREPNSKIIHHIHCKPSNLISIYSANSLDQYTGFVFAPFQTCKHLPIYIIPFGEDFNNIELSCSEKRKPLVATPDSFSQNIEKSKQSHKKHIETFLNAFRVNGIKKAVLSRNKWLGNYSIEDMPNLFTDLCENYPKAFIYQVYIPEAGYWVGATPELLFNTENGTATTVSLAGTQIHNESIHWSQKERTEQELVTEHIREVLREFDISDFKEIGPETAKAGKLAHIKTTIQLNKQKIANHVGEFIEQLHPTPAICGLPVKSSLNLIMQEENYDREYYSGYLGPFNSKEKINLFVNLRCLQAFDNGVVLYAGGGITPESDAEQEWEETRLKIRTLEGILENK